MVKAAPEAIARQITHLSRAAASFSQLITQDALCEKADHLRSASNNVVSLLSDDMVAQELGQRGAQLDRH